MTQVYIVLYSIMAAGALGWCARQGKTVGDGLKWFVAWVLIYCVPMVLLWKAYL